MNHSLRAAMIGLAAIFLFGTAAHAEFPERNITSVVTFSPGGGFDTISRAISRSIEKYLPKGVKAIVKNVTGAGGVTGTVYLYRSKPNGYTIGQMYGGMMPVPFLKGPEKAGYDFEKFVWLARVGGEPYALLLRNESKFKSLKDLQQAKRVTWGVEAIGAGRWFDAFIAAKEVGIPSMWCPATAGRATAFPAFFAGTTTSFSSPSIILRWCLTSRPRRSGRCWTWPPSGR